MKTYKVVFTPLAEKNMLSIYDYIAIEKGLPDSAIAYIRKLKEVCQTLEHVPVRGRKRDDIRENLRILALDKRTVAAFEIDEERKLVTVLGVFYGGRNYEVLMQE